jgi:hypothetical protein
MTNDESQRVDPRVKTRVWYYETRLRGLEEVVLHNITAHIKCTADWPSAERPAGLKSKARLIRHAVSDMALPDY